MTDAGTSTQPQMLAASEAGELIAAGSLSSEELTGACLEQIERLEPSVEAWQFVDPELALEEARARDAEAPHGPLHGIPVGLKDVIDTATMPTACGTLIYAGRRPAADARGVELLRAAGAVVLGKTVTTELATWQPDKTRNPHGPEHTPGGSSSGSAAAVAARMAPLALGTQTVGSTIRPASFCGVIGMKPTLDAVDLRGVRRTSHLLDTMGLFARTPADLRLLLTVLRGLERSEGAPASPLRVGVARTAWWDQADEHSQAALERAAAALRERGAAVGELRLPAELDAIDRVHDIVATVDIANHCAFEYDEHGALLSERMRSEIERGREIEPRIYLDAVAEAERGGAIFDACFDQLDVVLAPAVTGEAPRSLEWTGDPIFCRAWSMLGVPAATVPAGRGEHGLPVGVQLIGRKRGERAVLSAVEQLFEALGDDAAPLPPGA